MNLNEDYNGKTTLAKWWLIVKENFQKIVTAFNAEVKAREDAISTEKSEREAADSNLSNRLSAVEQVSGGTGGGSSLNNYDYKYDSEDPSVIYINTVTDLPYGIYTFIPEREVTALYTRVGDNVQSWDCEGNVFTPGNQYVLQTNSDSVNLDVIGVIPLEQNLINVKLSEIQGSVPTWFNTEEFAEVGKVLVIQNDLENTTLTTLPINDELWYTLSQPLEVGKIYVTFTKSLPEDYGIDGKVHGAIDVYAWNGPESGGGSSITVDSELSDDSENPVQNKVIKAELDNIKNSQITVSSTMNTTTTDPVEGGVIQVAIDSLGMRLESRIEDLEDGCTHTTTPTQIGTWIDGTPIWRVSFDVDYTFSADVKDSDGYYYPLNEVMNVDNTNYASILECQVFARCGAPCLIDDVVGFRNSQDYIYFSSLNESMHDGVYGYVDFICAEDNLK